MDAVNIQFIFIINVTSYSIGVYFGSDAQYIGRGTVEILCQCSGSGLG